MIPDAVPRAVVIAALVELEEGDVSQAYAILSDALDPPRVNRCFCDGCGQRFEWPGLLDVHQLDRGCGTIREPFAEAA